jgi:uncharacterized protein DUF6444
VVVSSGPAVSLPTSVEELRAVVVELMERRIAELERRLGEDSSTSSRPPSVTTVDIGVRLKESEHVAVDFCQR